MKRFPCLLVADDDENDLRLIARALPANAPEHPVCFVHDGSEALDYLYGRGQFAQREPEAPGCVLLDLHMPRVNGWDVLRQVKGDARLKPIPIVIFSSSDRERDIHRSYELGATAYVVKPIDSAAFRQTVAKIQAFWITCNQPERGTIPPAPSAATRLHPGLKYETA